MKTSKIFYLLLLLPFWSIAQNTPFKRVSPCSFGIDLPTEMSISKMYQDNSPDYCDYEVLLADGYPIMEIHSLLKSRFDFSNINEAYHAAIRSSTLKITYRYLGENSFVLSGNNPKNGNIIYWKRVIGRYFVSDMQIEYRPARRGNIEKYIARISKSFTSK